MLDNIIDDAADSMAGAQEYKPYASKQLFLYDMDYFCSLRCSKEIERAAANAKKSYVYSMDIDNPFSYRLKRKYREVMKPLEEESKLFLEKNFSTFRDIMLAVSENERAVISERHIMQELRCVAIAMHEPQRIAYRHLEEFINKEVYGLRDRITFEALICCCLEKIKKNRFTDENTLKRAIIQLAEGIDEYPVGRREQTDSGQAIILGIIPERYDN